MSNLVAVDYGDAFFLDPVTQSALAGSDAACEADYFHSRCYTVGSHVKIVFAQTF